MVDTQLMPSSALKITFALIGLYHKCRANYERIVETKLLADVSHPVAVALHSTPPLLQILKN